MFSVGKVFTCLILPPGGFALLLLIGAIIAFRRKSRLAGGMLTVAALLIYGLSIRPTADLLLVPLERSASVDAASTGRDRLPGNGELIILLGGGSIPARFAPNQVLSLASTARTVEAYALHRDTGLPILLTGGRPLSRADEAEAVSAARLLRRMGVREEAVIVEPESRNTWENAAQSRRLTTAESVLLVTSAYHMRRARECFTAHGFDVRTEPADFRAWEARYTLWDVFPDAGALYDSYAALHEYVGRVYYRIRYGSAGYRLE